ncbi:MAG TPA: HD domain-containing phosphohydrolase [Acidimicrobiia bacterium]|nr:HD domain-containing phosphohydrolase [Acidimicrobiia bacterium]
MTEQARWNRVRAAELVGSLSLAADLATGVPLEQGLHSTLIAMRLAQMLGLDPNSSSQTFYGCLLFYIGCTATADLAADLFGDELALTTYATPFRFGSRGEMVRGMMRAVAPPGSSPWRRAAKLAWGVPKLGATLPQVVAVNCEVAQLISGRLGLPGDVGRIFEQMAERWDGTGQPAGIGGDQIALPMRIIHVARDAAFQVMLHGPEESAKVIGERGGRAFDPHLSQFVAKNPEVLTLEPGPSLWEPVMEIEPEPHLVLEKTALDEALAAMGDFADLVSPYLVGHSAGVAELAGAAARLAGLDAEEIQRAATIHDLGRVTVPTRIWRTPTSLNTDDWEGVRLHSYYTERILAPSPFLSHLAPVATAHHERLDGSGYHRGVPAAVLSPSARLVAAADMYHAMIEPRPHRLALTAEEAVRAIQEEVKVGRLDAQAVAPVLEAVGRRLPRTDGPAGLTARELEVVGLLARGHQTKQIARNLNISPKTADRHIQSAYRKIGVSTRAGATLFAMQVGLVSWGEFPLSPPRRAP